HGHRGSLPSADDGGHGRDGRRHFRSDGRYARRIPRRGTLLAGSESGDAFDRDAGEDAHDPFHPRLALFAEQAAASTDTARFMNDAAIQYGVTIRYVLYY